MRYNIYYLQIVLVMNENLSEPVRCTMKLLFLLWRRKQIYGDLCLIRNTLCHKRLVFDTLLCIVCIFPNGNIGPCSKIFQNKSAGNKIHPNILKIGTSIILTTSYQLSNFPYFGGNTVLICLSKWRNVSPKGVHCIKYPFQI